MKALLRALGTQFNSESKRMDLVLERPPFEPELRKIIKNTRQVITTTTRVESWECLWWSGIKETVVIHYHVVHYLVRGDTLSYSRRTFNEPMDVKRLEKLHEESLFYVKGTLAEDEYFAEITG